MKCGNAKSKCLRPLEFRPSPNRYAKYLGTTDSSTLRTISRSNLRHSQCTTPWSSAQQTASAASSSSPGMGTAWGRHCEASGSGHHSFGSERDVSSCCETSRMSEHENISAATPEIALQTQKPNARLRAVIDLLAKQRTAGPRDGRQHRHL